MAALEQLSENLYLFRDACNVYVVRDGAEAVLVECGSGAVLDHLPKIGVSRVTDVLMTHHHRDGAQGLPRAAGARVWVPGAERDLFEHVEAHWQAREVRNNYNTREDRFSLLEPVPVAGPLRDYETRAFGGRAYTVLPTPGHTVGSVSLLATVDGRRLAFTGDLIHSPGRVASLAATQWTYNGGEGIAGSILSLLDLAEHDLELLLPSHGEPMEEPAAAMGLLVERLARLRDLRGQNPRLFELRARPYERISPQLLSNRTSMSNAYVLLSTSGKALFLDFGYDFCFGAAAGFDRASRRPWLQTLPALKRDFGVARVDVAIPTHYHDDHVAGLNLLREVEGTAIWAAESFADVLERPAHFDLPCLWHDPIPVHRRLPLERPVCWEEHELTLHALPGHTRHAVAVSFTVDGRRVLVSGDQYAGEDGLELNYVYKNGFEPSDYRASAALYRRLRPDLILTGHWPPLAVGPAYLEAIAPRGEALEALHAELLPPEAGLEACLRPYEIEARPGEPFGLALEVRNPFSQGEAARATLATPDGWAVEPPEAELWLEPGASGRLEFRLTPAPGSRRRARVAANLSLGNRPFGQAAEALVTVV